MYNFQKRPVCFTVHC